LMILRFGEWWCIQFGLWPEGQSKSSQSKS
jgi:hypothetical protein